MSVSPTTQPTIQNHYKVFLEKEAEIRENDPENRALIDLGMAVTGVAMLTIVALGIMLATSGMGVGLTLAGIGTIFFGPLVGGAILTGSMDILAEMVKHCNLRKLTIKKLAKEHEFTVLNEISGILTESEKRLVKELALKKVAEIKKQIETKITDTKLVENIPDLNKGDLLVEKLGALKEYKENLVMVLPRILLDKERKELRRKLEKVEQVIKLGETIVAAIPEYLKILEKMGKKPNSLISKLKERLVAIQEQNIVTVEQSLYPTVPSCNPAAAVVGE